MKVRITFWTMLTVAVAAAGVLVWQGQAVSPVKVTAPGTLMAQKQSVKISVAQVAPVPHAIMTIAKQAGETNSIANLIINSQVGYQEREDATKSLGKLTDNEREIIYGFLRQHPSQDDQQLGQVLKNKLLDALCQMQPPPQGLRELLTQIYEDRGQNVVLRDYAIQHLAAFYQQMAQAQGIDPEAQSDELKQTRQTLWDALSEIDSSIAGTALLGLSHLSQQGFDGFDQSKIGDKALELAGQNGNELTRITALQVCASLNVHDAISIVLGAAQAGETESVKISAIGALGALGGKDQISFLNNMIKGNDERLKLPAQQALSRLNQRLTLVMAKAN